MYTYIFIYHGNKKRSFIKYFSFSGRTLESVGYTNWEPGQPTSQPESPAPVQNCVDLSRKGRMSDTYCPWKLAYICEKPIIGPPEISDVTTNSTDVQVQPLLNSTKINEQNDS